jgi:lipopolysaccharide/colanic/teichoic acid biosynthesis glycosyltransferase
MVKNSFDFIVSLIGLILLFPLFMILSMLIIFNDHGPVFFKQTRVGKGGKNFILYKFRSMKVVDTGSEATFEPGNTGRVTAIGRLLRRTKLDELPQLFNVLKGDMSFVGPRPEIRTWVDVYPEEWNQILTVKPGITDNASLEFSNEESILAGSDNPEQTYREIILPRKLELYKQYIIQHSFPGDLKLMLMTVILVLKKGR